MGHILIVDDEGLSREIAPWLWGRGHTVDSESERGVGPALRRAERNPYDLVVARTGLRTREAEFVLREIPVRSNGLPVRVLLTDERCSHARRLTRDPPPWADLMASPNTTYGLTLAEILQQAIELAYARAKAHVERSVPAAGRHFRWETRRRNDDPPEGAGPTREADRQAAVRQIERIVHSQGGRVREMRWFPGPKAACQHLLEWWERCAFLGEPSFGPSPEDQPLGDLDTTLMGRVPWWAATERAALRMCMPSNDVTAAGGLDLLLASVHRGLGSPYHGIPSSWGEGGGRPDPVPGFHQLWWWLLDDETVVAADRPVSLTLDAGDSPHSMTGPVISYADGFKVYALHGRPVRAEVIEHPERITVAEIRACTDAELRRALRELYGDERFFADTLARVVDVDTVPVDALAPGSLSLTRALVEDDEGHRFLVASDGSTSRVYHMRVPRSCRTCAEAYVALSGRPDVRTILEA